MTSPLEQFEIFEVVPRILGIKFTNYSLTFSLLVLSITLSFHFFLRNARVIATRWQAFLEFLYLYILGILVENAGKRSQVYFPFIFVLFTFILTGNVFGMLPLGYTITSQALITFLLSSTVFLGSIFVGLWKHNVNFFSLFFPSGSPTSLSFLLVPIEIISFISKPFSLGIRLFANMLAGHVLLKIMAGFIFSALYFSEVFNFVTAEVFYFFAKFNNKILSFFFSVESVPNLATTGIFSETGYRISYSVLDVLITLLGGKVGAKAVFWTSYSAGYLIGFIIFPLEFFIKLLVVGIPMSLLIAFILLEIGIVFLQAYVFTILSSIYVGDAINLH